MHKIPSCPAAMDHMDFNARRAASPLHGPRPMSPRPSPSRVCGTPLRQRRSSYTPPAALPLPMAHMMFDFDAEAISKAVKGVSQEIQLEASLHVPALQAAQCQSQYGFASLVAPDLVTAASLGTEVPPAAPSNKTTDSPFFLSKFPAAEELLQRGSLQRNNSSIISVESLGACLATPVEAVTESLSFKLSLTASARTAAVTQLQTANDVTTVADRWVEWARRMRRKRRQEQVQTMLSMLVKPSLTSRKDETVEHALARLSLGRSSIDSAASPFATDSAASPFATDSAASTPATNSVELEACCTTPHYCNLQGCGCSPSSEGSSPGFSRFRTSQAKVQVA